MPALKIRLDVDQTGGMPELAGKVLHRTEDVTMTTLSGGMQSGKPSVQFIAPLPDGSFVYLETSLELLLSAADAARARHGDPRR